MTQQVTKEDLVLVTALRQSLEMESGPGSSINGTANQFIVHVVGEVDLLKMGRRALTALRQYLEAEEARVQKEAEAAAKAAAEALLPDYCQVGEAAGRGLAPPPGLWSNGSTFNGDLS